MIDASVLVRTIIGLSLIYLGLSIAVITLLEIYGGLLHKRERQLKQGLVYLFGEAVERELIKHPLLRSVMISRRYPTYIPPDLLADVVVDIFRENRDLVVNSEIIPEQFKASLRDNDFEQLKQRLEDWYMLMVEELVASYSLQTRKLIAVTTFVLAVALNINTIAIVEEELFTKPAFDQHLAAASEAFYSSYYEAEVQASVGSGTSLIDAISEGRVANPEQWARQMADVSSPTFLFGWSGGQPDLTWPKVLVNTIPGWILTAIAVSFLAPILYNQLQRRLVY